jgi:hypothetical protein
MSPLVPTALNWVAPVTNSAFISVSVLKCRSKVRGAWQSSSDHFAVQGLPTFNCLSACPILPAYLACLARLVVISLLLLTAWRNNCRSVNLIDIDSHPFCHRSPPYLSGLVYSIVCMYLLCYSILHTIYLYYMTRDTYTTRFHSSKQPPSRGKFMAPPSSFLAATAERCRLPDGGVGIGIAAWRRRAVFVLQPLCSLCDRRRRRQKQYSSIASFRTAVVRNLQAVTDSSAHHNPGEALTEIYFILTWQQWKYTGKSRIISY